MESLVEATLAYLAYCTSKEPRVRQHYPIVKSADFRKQQVKPHTQSVVEEIFDLIDFDALQDTPENRLLIELGKYYAALHWRDMDPNYAGQAFAQNYTACIFAAPDFDFWKDAHYHLDNLSVGFTVQHPHTLYPDHHHEALEIYATLYGKASWRRRDSPFKEKGAGTLVYHDRNENHAMRTDNSYLITFYAWAGELESPPVVPNIPD